MAGEGDLAAVGQTSTKRADPRGIPVSVVLSCRGFVPGPLCRPPRGGGGEGPDAWPVVVASSRGSVVAALHGLAACDLQPFLLGKGGLRSVSRLGRSQRVSCGLQGPIHVGHRLGKG